MLPQLSSRTHLDHLGTIRLWTLADGSSPEHLNYTAFGEEIGDNTLLRDHQYTGHERDRLRTDQCMGTTVIDGEIIDTGQTRTGCDGISSEDTTISSPDEVRFVAGSFIEMGEGFNVVSGAVFAAEIDGGLRSDLRDLDYMHARYCNPSLGRFLTTDPADSSRAGAPQRWNRYSYALNNPMKFVDPNGESPLKYFIRLVDEGVRAVSRATARRAARNGQDIFVSGEGSKAAQSSLAREAYGRGNIVRHSRQEGSLPHLQPKKRTGRLRTGHIFRGKPNSAISAFLALATAGAAAGDEVEAATASAGLGDLVEFGVDFTNPAADVLALEQLLESIGVLAIELTYNVEIREDEAEEP